VVGEKASNSTAADRFQDCGDTISYYYNNVHLALINPYTGFVKVPPLATLMEIQNNKNIIPFFKDCLGAADGIYIYTKVEEEESVRFGNRKGQITQNVLGICKFNFQFSYVYHGWERSAHDARVLDTALGDDLSIPNGKYYLVDAG